MVTDTKFLTSLLKGVGRMFKFNSSSLWCRSILTLFGVEELSRLDYSNLKNKREMVIFLKGPSYQVCWLIL